MGTDPDQTAWWRRLEMGRFALGAIAEVGIKAYGAGAALAVALSDAESVGGKVRDAVAAIPSLTDEYHDARYVMDHREEIQGAVDYLSANTPPQAELEAAAAEGADTLQGIDTTYSELQQAKESIESFKNPFDFDYTAPFDHVGAAWDAKPDLDALRQLAELADQAGPALGQVEVLTPVYYGGLLKLTDNFASDEIAGTICVMVLAFLLASALAQAAGFWVRRGRPGIIAHLLQQVGARIYRRWYVDNLPYALGPSLDAVARERMQRDIVADPERALDAEAREALAAYFSGSPTPPPGANDQLAP